MFSTGIPELDEALGGGIRGGKVTLIYGEEKSGKTSLALKVCALAAKKAGQAGYVDCSGRLHPQRLLQVLEANGADPSKVSVSVIGNFLQQEEIILSLHDKPPSFPLIIFDDFTYQHRIELTGDARKDVRVYKRLAFQIAALKEAASRNRLAVVVVGQVHTLPDTGEARLVAQRILTYWSDTIIKITKPMSRRCSYAYVEKPVKVGPIRFEIVDGGVAPCLD